ncbi:MAG TPA: HAMP domain-containing sensor histidine kinase [Gemmatimonadales bacterium]
MSGAYSMPGRSRRGSPPAPPPFKAFPGISCPVLTRAIREVEAEIVPTVDPSEQQNAAQLLAAVGLAVGQRAPVYLIDLSPRHPQTLTRRVIDALRAALLRAWSRGPLPTPSTRVLRHLVALEELRTALDADAAQAFGAQLSGPDGADLLAEVVHDLRSPLTSILFLAETLEGGRSGPVTDLQRRQLRLVYSAALRLSVVAGDAIELARGGDILASEEPGVFSVIELLAGIRDIVRPIAEEKGLTILIVTPPNDHRVGLRLALHRVLLNLVANALKFTHQGTVELLANEAGPTRVNFAVRDSGPGIAPTAVSTLFRPFRRARAEQRYRFSSTGLGLAVSRRLVAAMGAELQYETAAGQGTRFWFETELPPA